MKYLILLFILFTIINGDIRRLLQTNPQSDPACSGGTVGTCDSCDQSTCQSCNRANDLTKGGVCTCRCSTTHTGVCDGFASTCPTCTLSTECATGFECKCDNLGVCGCEAKVCATGEGLDPHGECMQICGTIQGLTCPDGYGCVDDPRDNCDPKANDADCSGFCVEIPTCTAGTVSPCNTCTISCGPCHRVDGAKAGVCSCECDMAGVCGEVTTHCPQCSLTSDCRTGYICDAGSCVPDTTTCTAGNACSSCDRSGCTACSYGGSYDCKCECDTNNECATVDRTCPTDPCEGIDCPSTEVCKNGACVTPPNGCTAGTISACTTCTKSCEPCYDADGTKKGVCSCECDDAGVCGEVTSVCPTCAVNSECHTGYICDGGSCVIDPCVNVQCTSPDFCKDGHCVTPPACTGTTCDGCDISSCEHCSDGITVVGTCECECVTDECVGKPSITMICPDSGCRVHTDCTNGYCNTAGECQTDCTVDKPCETGFTCNIERGKCMADTLSTCTEGESCTGCSMGLMCGQCKDGSPKGWCGDCTCDNTLTCQPVIAHCSCTVDDDCDGCCNGDTGYCATETSCVTNTGVTDPCETKTCETGEKCVANYCGGCNAECVPDDICDEHDCDICPNGGKVCNNKHHGCAKRDCPVCSDDALRAKCKDDDPPSNQGSITFETAIKACKVDNRFPSWGSIVRFIKTAVQKIIAKVSDNECMVESSNYFAGDYTLTPLTATGTEFVDNGKIPYIGVDLTSCSSNDDCEDDEECRSRDQCYMGSTSTSTGLACEGFCIKISGFDCSETCYDDDGTFVPNFKIETEIVVSCPDKDDDELAEGYKKLVNMGQQLDVDLIEVTLAESISADWKCEEDGLGVIEIAKAELTLTGPDGNVIDSQIYTNGAVEYSIFIVMGVVLVIFSWM